MVFEVSFNYSKFCFHQFLTLSWVFRCFVVAFFLLGAWSARPPEEGRAIKLIRWLRVRTVSICGSSRHTTT